MRVQQLKSSVMFLWQCVYFGRQVFKLQSRCCSSHSRDTLVLFSVSLLTQSDPSSVCATCSSKNNWWTPDGSQFDCNAAWIKPQGSIISAFIYFHLPLTLAQHTANLSGDDNQSVMPWKNIASHIWPFSSWAVDSRCWLLLEVNVW